MVVRIPDAFGASLEHILRELSLVPLDHPVDEARRARLTAMQFEAVLVGDSPVVLCAEVCKAHQLACSPVMRAILGSNGYFGAIRYGRVNGTNLRWDGAVRAINWKPSGQSTPSDITVAIILDDPGFSLTYAMVLVRDLAVILDPKGPNISQETVKRAFELYDEMHGKREH